MNSFPGTTWGPRRVKEKRERERETPLMAIALIDNSIFCPGSTPPRPWLIAVPWLYYLIFIFLDG